jgi:putative PIN family toxin of toxin-antitoxin system
MTSEELRLVLDTSIIVAAFRSRIGASARLLHLLAAGRFTAVATPTLLLEYESVLSRPEHRAAMGLSLSQVHAVIQQLAALITPVRVDFQWRPQLADPDDEMVLEAAINGFAYAIVTHNVRHFQAVAPNFNVRVCTPGVMLSERFA